MAEVLIRPLSEADLEHAAEVVFVAFFTVAAAHGVAPALGTPGESREYLRHLLCLDPLGGFVAVDTEGLVGVAWSHVRSPVATVGPLAVLPRAEGQGIGQRLLDACVAGGSRGLAQVRLVHESFNVRALGFYLRAGFRVVAPLLELERPAGPDLRSPEGGGLVLRAATRIERDRIIARDARAFGASRPQNIDLFLDGGEGVVAMEGERLVGYALGAGGHRLAYLGSAAGDDAGTLLALVRHLTGRFGARGLCVRTLVAAGDRPLVDGLLTMGFRVTGARQYLVRGGGTAPPANYLLMNGDLM